MMCAGFSRALASQQEAHAPGTRRQSSACATSPGAEGGPSQLYQHCQPQALTPPPPSLPPPLRKYIMNQAAAWLHPCRKRTRWAKACVTVRAVQELREAQRDAQMHGEYAKRSTDGVRGPDAEQQEADEVTALLMQPKEEGLGK